MHILEHFSHPIVLIFDYKMHVIAHKAIGVDSDFGFFLGLGKKIDIGLSIGIVFEDDLVTKPLGNDMVIARFTFFACKMRHTNHSPKM